MDMDPKKENEIPHNKDITYFAKTNFRNTNEVFGIKRKDRRQHMYILGKSGTGKSVLLQNLIVQNIQNGEGVCVVDPHGETVEEVLNLIPDYRAKDVIYFNPADTDFHIGFNVIQLDDPKYKHLVASGLMGIFTKIWANAWSSRMEYILNNAILALLDTPGTTLLGIPRLLVDKDYRQMIIGNLKDPVVKAFWIHEYEQWREQFRNEAIAPIQNKVGQFLSTSIIRNVVGQQKSTIDIFDIMNQGKIFLVNVSKGRIGEDNSALLGGMIITKIQLAAMERVRIPEEERKDFYLYVDEFQNFATDAFANILSEARKYRLNLIVAHQYTAQLENKDGSKVRDAVFGNVGTMIIFRVGGDDAEFLEKEFEPEFVALDLVNLPNYNIYVKLMIDGVTSRPFSATTLPPIKVDISKGVKEKIIEESRKNYARPREEVEDQINKWTGTLQMGESGEARYKVDCSNCKKSTMVPFEPQEGRPVYCKECMFKIKSGELKPEQGFSVAKQNRQEENTSIEPLAALGIEFTGDSKLAPYKFENKNDSPKPNIPNNNSSYNKPQFTKSSFIKPNTQNTSSPSNQSNQSNVNYQNRTDNRERKHSGPSPLLKGLLDKIKEDNKLNSNKETVIPKEVEEVKKETPKPISLSELSKQNNFNGAKNNNYVAPTKEASEENKSSLKDILAKAMIPKPSTKSINIPTDTNVLADKQADKEVKIEEKVEVKVEPKIEIKEVIKSEPTIEIKPELKVEMKPEPKQEEPQVEDTKNNQDNSWQKHQTKKEVPEDVLKKILE